MRIKVKSMQAAETLSHLFGESHIEYVGRQCYLVVDRVKKMAVA